MKIANKSCDIIKSVLNIVNSFLEETVILFSEKGIGIADYDLSKTVFISVIVKKEKFEEYNTEGDLQVAIKLKNIHEIFNKTTENESFSISLEDDKRLLININGETVREYSLPLIDLEYKDIKEPVYEFKTSILIPFSILSQIIENAKLIGENIKFIISENKISFDVSETNKKGFFKIAEDSNSRIKIENNGGNFSSEYYLPSLSGIINSLSDKKDITCKMYFGENLPLKLEFNNNDFKVSFYLGPKIESN